MATSPRDLLVPTRLLKAAINGVPAVKYALGVAGILSALAIVKGAFTSTEAALLWAVAMILAMWMLLIFATASRLGPTSLRLPALICTYAATLIFCASAVLALMTVFFDWPKSLSEITRTVSADEGLSAVRPRVQVPLLIFVTDEVTKERVVNAAVYVDDSGSEACPRQFSQAHEPVQCNLDEGSYRVVVNYKGQTRSQPIQVFAPKTSVTISIPTL